MQRSQIIKLFAVMFMVLIGSSSLVLAQTKEVFNNYNSSVECSITADAGQPTAKKAFDFRVPEHGGYTDTSKPTITWPIRFMTSLQDAKGNVQRGDPDVTIQLTYKWVGK